MARTYPSSEEIQSMLREGHFGQSRDLPPADPITATPMLLEIDRIKPFERNPRKERNPLYEEIKASIRAQGGLNNPLTVTRRPGDALYMVESGGNTRLQILHEFWEASGDERFFRIHCLFRPWVSESHVLTAHLIENDTRGALTFIDKALGLRALRDILETEREEPLSQRQLVEALKERGYGLDQSTISRMDYAVDVLLPVIPEALRAGMGAPQIRRIRRLEAAARVAWSRQAEGPARFEALFQEALGAHDGPHWELEPVQRELETQLAESLGVSLKQVRLEIDARLAGGTDDQSTPKPTPEPEPHSPSATLPPVEWPPVVMITTAMAPEATDPSPAPTTDSMTTMAQDRRPERTAPQDTSIDEVPIGSEPPHLTIPSVASYDGPSDLKSLRSRGYVLALKIAKRHHLEDCVTPAGRLGMGFLVDLPGESLLPVAGEEHALTQLYRQWVWWLLLSLSEETVQLERMERVPEELLLRNLILERTDAQALALVGEPDWKALGYEFFNNPSVPEPTIEDLVALAQTCRRIRQTMNDHGGLTLWQPDGAE